MSDYWRGYCFGQLDAYIHMIQIGVKDIGTPNVLFERDSPLWVVVKN